MKNTFIFISLLLVIFSCKKPNDNTEVIVEKNYRPKIITSESIENGESARIEYYYADDKISEVKYMYEFDNEYYLVYQVNYTYSNNMVTAIAEINYGDTLVEISKLDYTIESGHLTLMEIADNTPVGWHYTRNISYSYQNDKLSQAIFRSEYEGNMDASEISDYFYEDGEIVKCNYSTESLDWEVHRHDVFVNSDLSWEITLIRDADSMIWEKDVFYKSGERYTGLDSYGRYVVDSLYLVGQETYTYNSIGLLSEIVSGINIDSERISIEYEEGISNLDQIADPHSKACKTISVNFFTVDKKAIKAEDIIKLVTLPVTGF